MIVKTLIPILLSIGALAIFYGMLKKVNIIFIAGIISVIIGYLMVRFKLKKSINDREQ